MTIPEELESLRKQNHELKQALVDADATARDRGDEYGLCDSIWNDGAAYPSAWLHDILERARSEGIIPTRTVMEVLHAEKWYRFLKGNK